MLIYGLSMKEMEEREGKEGRKYANVQICKYANNA